MGLVASKGTAAASGIWTLRDMRDYCATGKWPGSGGSTPPAAPPGGDPLYSQVRALYHFDAEINSSGSLEYSDTSSYGVRLRNAGGASFVTNLSKFGGGSVLFPYATSTAYLFSTASAIAPATLYSIGGADNFTLEAWIFAASQTNQRLTMITNCDTSVTTQRGFALYLQYFLYWGQNSGAATLSATMPYSQWTHIAVSRAGGTVRLFVDGVQQSSASDYSSYVGDAYTLLFGGGPGAGGFGGWIDECRLTIGDSLSGAGRYTANFTPPTAPFPDAL